MVICSAVHCSNRSGRDNVSYFCFPKIIFDKGVQIKDVSTRRLKEWLSRVNRADLNISNVKQRRICSKHFIQGKPSDLMEETNPDWAPSLNLGHSKYKKDMSEVDKRYYRACQRNAAKKNTVTEDQLSDVCPAATSEVGISYLNNLPMDNSAWESDAMLNSNLSMLASTASLIEMDVEAYSNCVDVCIQTDCTMQQISELETEIENLRKEKEVLKVKSYTNFTEEVLNDDKRMQFYTGLPSAAVVKKVFDFIQPCVSYQPISLTLFQSFMIFMIRLRLNLLLQEIAYRFSIAQSTVTRIFDVWLEAAFISMSQTILWPERHVLQETMPTDFKIAFGTSVAVIVDCFEIFIDRPTSLVTRAATWSNYKHHNTVKLLIGIAPQGVITYISDSFGGRVSDKYITESCGILEKLLPGDIIMADRGFNIDDAVGFYCATLIKPASARGKTQLCPDEIKQTREVAALRIHVERVIGNLRQKYNILKGQLPIECLTTKKDDKIPSIDKIVKVCCSFTNLSKSVVPLD